MNKTKWVLFEDDNEGIGAGWPKAVFDSYDLALAHAELYKKQTTDYDTASVVCIHIQEVIVNPAEIVKNLPESISIMMFEYDPQKGSDENN